MAKYYEVIVKMPKFKARGAPKKPTRQEKNIEIMHYYFNSEAEAKRFKGCYR